MANKLKNNNDFIYTKLHWKNGNIAPDVKQILPHSALSCRALRSKLYEIKCPVFAVN